MLSYHFEINEFSKVFLFLYYKNEFHLPFPPGGTSLVHLIYWKVYISQWLMGLLCVCAGFRDYSHKRIKADPIHMSNVDIKWTHFENDYYISKRRRKNFLMIPASICTTRLGNNSWKIYSQFPVFLTYLLCLVLCSLKFIAGIVNNHFKKQTKNLIKEPPSPVSKSLLCSSGSS
jgi:hypothetical protein